MAEELTTTSTGLSERPAFIPVGDRTGTEHITRQDVKMPRLLLAQALSPEVQETESAFIPELRVGMLFNDLTKSVYGKGPIEFIILRADPPRWVEFVPREEGGGIKDPNVLPGDPRTIPGPDGKTVATQFYDFVLRMLPSNEDIALSLKGKSGVRAAKALNGLIMLRNAPCFAGNYIMTASMVKNPKGTFAVYLTKNNGWAKSPEEFDFRKKLHEALKDKELVIEREDRADDVDEDATSFDPSKM